MAPDYAMKSPRLDACGSALTFIISLPFISRPPYMEAHGLRKKRKEEKIREPRLFLCRSIIVNRSIYLRPKILSDQSDERYTLITYLRRPESLLAKVK